jgi:isocitrate dehydrogenase
VNPGAGILLAEMMLLHTGGVEAADPIIISMEKCIFCARPSPQAWGFCLHG